MNIQYVDTEKAVGSGFNCQSNASWMPLHWAAFGGHEDVFKLLIAKGGGLECQSQGWQDAALLGRSCWF